MLKTCVTAAALVAIAFAPALAQNSNTSTRAKLAELEDQVDELDDRVNVLEGQGIDSRLSVLEGQDLDGRLTALDGRVGTIETELDGLAADLGSRLGQLESRLDALDRPGPGANLVGKTLAVALGCEPLDLPCEELTIGIDLRGANLADADLSGLFLVGANLAGANLTGAKFVDADLSSANLVGASLVGANLRGALLTGADMTGANLSFADLGGATIDTGPPTNLNFAVLRGAFVDLGLLGDGNKAVQLTHTICPDGTDSAVEDGDSSSCEFNLDNGVGL